MTEDEAKKALFEIHQEYMKHPKEERLRLYDEYQNKRNSIKTALANMRLETDENTMVKKSF